MRTRAGGGATVRPVLAAVGLVTVVGLAACGATVTTTPAPPGTAVSGSGTSSVTSTPSTSTATDSPSTASTAGSTAGSTTGAAAKATSRRPATRREPTPKVPASHRCDSWVEWGSRPDHGRDVGLPSIGPWTNVIRTDMTDDVAWARVRARVLAGAAAESPDAPLPFQFVDTADFEGVAPQAFLKEDSDDYQGRYVLLVADDVTMRDEELTLAVVLLHTDGLEPFRVTPAAAAELVRGWESVPGAMTGRDACDLEAASGKDGVFRG